MLMLARAETYEQRAEEAPTLRNAHTPACNVGQGRRMRCYKRAPCSLSSCFMHANRYLPPRCVHPPEICRSGREEGVVSLVRRTKLLAFVRVVVVCRWCVAAGLPLPWLAALHGGRYPRAINSHPMHHQPSSPHRSAPHILGSEQQILPVFCRAGWPGSSRHARCKVCFSCHPRILASRELLARP